MRRRPIALSLGCCRSGGPLPFWVGGLPLFALLAGARFGFAGICAARGESRTDEGLGGDRQWAPAVRAERQRCPGFWGRGRDQTARLADRPGRTPHLLRQRSALRYAATVTQVGEALLERTGARLLGLGEVQTVAGLGGSLLAKHRPGHVHRGIPGNGDLTVGVERFGEFVGPARGGPVAVIGAVGTAADSRLGFGSSGVTALPPPTTVGHGTVTPCPTRNALKALGLGLAATGACRLSPGPGHMACGPPGASISTSIHGVNMWRQYCIQVRSQQSHRLSHIATQTMDARLVAYAMISDGR